MEFESRGCPLGRGSCGEEKSTLRGLESGANKTHSPSPGPSCCLLTKILQEFGEKEENRVRAEQEQGIVGDIWGEDATLCLRSVLCEGGLEQVWLVPALSVSLGHSFPALCSSCAGPAVSLVLRSLPDAGFRWLPLAG